MTPRFHEEFVALCALFYSGEISEEEWALLQVHMAYCDSCQHVFEQYQQIHEGVIPAMAAAVTAESASAPYETASAFADAESRLMSRVKGATDPAQPKLVPRRPSLRVWGGVLAACIVVLAVFAYSHLVRSRETSQHVSVSQLPAKIPSVPVPTATGNPDGMALQWSQDEVARLRQQISVLENRPTPSDPVAATDFTVVMMQRRL